MDDYPSNSNRSKEAQTAPPISPDIPKVEQRLKPVVREKAQIREKSEFEKIIALFLPQDVTDWKLYLLAKVVVPAVKSFANDLIDNTKNAILWGNQGSPSNNIYSANNMNYWRGSNGYQSNAMQNSYNGGFSYNDPYINQANNREIVVRTYQDGMNVLNAASQIINSQGYVTVLQMFDLSGNGHLAHATDANYGWYDIRNSQVVRYGNVYAIKTPRIVLVGGAFR